MATTLQIWTQGLEKPSWTLGGCIALISLGEMYEWLIERAGSEPSAHSRLANSWQPASTYSRPAFATHTPLTYLSHSLTDLSLIHI